jgi:inner membrane protein involved in colicin E2 resistance
MSAPALAQPNPQPFPAAVLQTRSMGAKLILISLLALVMSLPAIFVSGLVDDRSTGAEAAAQHQTQPPTTAHLFGSPIRLVGSYRSVNRSLKYVTLFLGLVFLTYFVFEVTTAKRVHPAQYILVGTAQIIFYLLLLSLAEKIGFDLAFLFAGGATVGLLSTNAGWVFSGRRQGSRALVVFTLLYLLIYLLLRLQDDALLIGAVSSFAAVGTVMYFTRNIDWYTSLSGLTGPKPNPSSPPHPAS